MGKNFSLVILSLLLALNILAWIVVFDLSKIQPLEVVFFDVGQGDSIFIETPKKQQILIDGGPGSAILEKLGTEMPFYDNTLDLIILTHPEKDHLAGLLEVLKRYKVENILWTGIIRDTAEWKLWERKILEKKASIKIAQAGQKIFAAKAVLEILYPFENLAGQEFEDSNETSIVSRLVFGENSFLFTGDIRKSEEKALLEQRANLDSDVLKVAHHGSKTSNSKEFIEKVSPEIAVISLGKENSYGHPHQEVLDILEDYGIKVLRTDQHGNIKIISDGKKLTIPNF
jgi:competence protein ComEC